MCILKVLQHQGETHLISGWNDEGNHGRAISSGLLQALDQFLDLPDLDILVGGCVFGHCDLRFVGEVVYLKGQSVMQITNF